MFLKANDFFLDWLPDTDSLKNTTHPDDATRKQYLIEGFESILHNVPYYRFATVLAHFGHCRDAQHLLEDFLNRVETTEAFSNLGYVHLQQAREEMHVKMAYKYWIPTLLEPASSLDILRERGLFEQALPPAALQHLEKAEQYLKQAISMDDDQLVSHINLAAVYLYMPDKVHHAFAAIEDAKRTQLGNVPAIQRQIESIDQLIRITVNDDTADRWPSTRDTLERLASEPAAEVRRYLTENWGVNSPPPKLLPGLKAQVYLNEHADSLLALDDHVEMMILRDIPTELNELSKLQTKYGNPTVSLPLKGGHIVSFGRKWAALIEKNQELEIWVSDLFGGDSAKTSLK